MLKRIIKIAVSLLWLIIVFILFSNVWIVGSTRNLIFNNTDLGNHPNTIMILGTSSKTMDGHENPFFNERIKTSIDLYKKGKIKRIILSGDHETRYYDEPMAMRKALVDAGVPDAVLISDGGGVRTLDSVVRCKEVHKIKEVIIVTQRFHGYRALFISNYYKLNAIVVATNPIEFPRNLIVLLREILARPLAVIDLYVLHRQPKLGEVNFN